MGFLNDLYAARGRVLPDRKSPYVIGDKAPYISPMDRKEVHGRAAHREHMKAHGVLEAGDMKIGEYSNTENSPMPAASQDIVRAIQELNR